MEVAADAGISMFELQPFLQNEFVNLRPLQLADFEALFAVANDPLLWEQHPNRDRYKREVFENFFKGAMDSGGAFFVTDTKSGDTLGCSRYYDFDPGKRQVLIGYTFIARSYWGKSYNRALKTIMLNHAFRFVDKVHFHIGATNFRSQKSIEKIGAKKVGEAPITYFGEQPSQNFIYEIAKVDWMKQSS